MMTNSHKEALTSRREIKKRELMGRRWTFFSISTYIFLTFLPLNLFRASNSHKRVLKYGKLSSAYTEGDFIKIREAILFLRRFWSYVGMG